jgi:DedD protein
MDQALKQRLVGAIVITALAAIFVPMLFDDPVNQSSQQINALEIPPLPEKLQQAQARKLPVSVEDVRQKTVKKPTWADNVKKPVQFEDWYIQAGGFGVYENALKLRNRLRQQGFSASIVKETGKNGPLFKVRVGPEISRKQAEKVKARLEKLNQLNSFITHQKAGT